MVVQDQLKLLKYYDVPVIDGKEHPETELKHHKKQHRTKKTEHGPILKFLKKCLYFKPKTFMGATILAAVLTTISGGIMTSCFQKTQMHHKRRPDKVLHDRNQTTNVISNIESQKMYQTLKQLYTLYQFGQNWFVQNDEVLICHGCGDMVPDIKTQKGKDVQITCITCQKPFQNAISQMIEQSELTR